jgi:hypothetical protein
MYPMSELQSRPVDPRDQQWELLAPAYRVTFWRSAGGGWASREYEVWGGDVAAVLQWANEHAGTGETFALDVVIDRSDGLGVVRLLGDDPTSADSALRKI